MIWNSLADRKKGKVSNMDDLNSVGISSGLVIAIILVVIILIIFASCINIVPQAHAYIVERLGGYLST